jgi:branched-chain amino acid transport system permease protein
VLAVAVAGGLFWFLGRTSAGRSMRAYADNRNLALLSGVDPERIVRITWLLVAVLSVVGGVLFGLDKGFRPFVYQQLLLPMFAAAVVGGLGSPIGAIVGSLIVAFSEIGLTFAWKKFLGYLLPGALAPEGMTQLLTTEYKFAVSFLILVVVLLIRRPVREGRAMNDRKRAILLYAGMAALLLAVGFGQSWQLALAILNLCLISAVMALGVNLQWGVAGMLNVGTMGFAAAGGLAVVLVSAAPVPAAWSAGGAGLAIAAAIVAVTTALVVWVRGRIDGPVSRGLATAAIVVVGHLLAQRRFLSATAAIEAADAPSAGYLGGLGLPVPLSWIGGGVLAGLLAWPVAKLTAGLRADYLAVATFGISEIVFAVLRNEDWLARGVKNVTGLPRPVPFETDLQSAGWVQSLATRLDLPLRDMASILVKLAYTAWFVAVLLLVFWLLQRLGRAPWGWMMRAIRDNEEAARAMGKDVNRSHLQAFVLGSAIVGIGGVMLVTIDGQFTAGSYQPIRYTFLIWLMVIVGGSGNHRGAILGAFVIWFTWVQAEAGGLWLAERLAGLFAPDSTVRAAIEQSPAQLRYVVMGLILILAMRFFPRGLLPEETPEPPK